jgi:hypothetical protein
MRVMSMSPTRNKEHTMTERKGKAELIDVKELLRRDEDFLRAATAATDAEGAAHPIPRSNLQNLTDTTKASEKENSLTVGAEGIKQITQERTMKCDFRAV